MPEAAFRISRLSEEWRGELQVHFAALSAQDLYLRFGSHSRPEVVQHYVAHIDFGRSSVLGCFGLDGVLTGVAHLSPDVLEWELGLSVDPQYRGQGIGTRLIRQALNDARRAGAPQLRMHCLAENHALLRIVKGLGADVMIRDGSAEGIILCSSRQEAAATGQASPLPLGHAAFALRSAQGLREC